MKTPFKGGLIEPRLSKPETIILRKAQAILEQLAVMKPVRPVITAASDRAAKETGCVLTLIGHEAQEYLPLLDDQPANPDHGTADGTPSE